MNEKLKEVVLVNSLLHDIGKFLWRFDRVKSPGNELGHTIREVLGYSHPFHSYKFSSENIAGSFFPGTKEMLPAAFHHKPSSLNSENARLLLYEETLTKQESELLRKAASIIQKADHLSSSEREEKEKEEENSYDKTKNKALMNPLSRVYRMDSGEGNYFPYSILENNFPSVSADEDALRRSPADFPLLEKDLKSISNMTSFADKFNRLALVLQKHLQFVPSATYVSLPTVSLYDHLKMTAAIAHCIVESTSDKKYAFVMLDYSGIQKFIFSSFRRIPKPASTIRGRSFFLTLLSDAVLRYFKRELELYDINVVMDNGGIAVLLIPNTEGLEEKVKLIEKNVNRYLLENHGPSLKLFAFCTAYGDEAFSRSPSSEESGFPAVIEDLRKGVNSKKYRFASEFPELIGDYNSRGSSPSQLSEDEVCLLCGRKKKMSSDEPDGMCSSCSGIHRMGRELKNADTISIFLSKEEGSLRFSFGDFHISYSAGFHSAADAILRINSSDFERIPTSFKFIGNYAPSNPDGTIKDFSELAGTPSDQRREHGKMAMIKSDIDYLGNLFREGFLRNSDGKGSVLSPSSYSFTSFLLNHFYSLKINKLAEKNEQYVVFAGGDDLTIIGEFSKAKSFMTHLRDAFLEFTGNNENLSYSLAYILFSPSEPIHLLVEKGESELRSAKSHRPEKNTSQFLQVSVENERWPDLTDLIEKILYFSSGHAEEISSSFFSKLLVLINRSLPERSGHEEAILNPVPYFYYMIARTLRSKKREEARQIFEHYLTPDASASEFRRKLLFLKGALSYFILERRYHEVR